ncbi:LysR family transcriptional regulator [Nocardia sp. NPDC004860]|uniref:LysR family transcriptional regulator n=1 Tax=Nocardia sp. NPDC004860 TaxID=3154557 RepID=UPI0033A78541
MLKRNPSAPFRGRSMFPPNAQNPDGVSDDRADLDRCDTAGHSRESLGHNPFRTSDQPRSPRTEVRCRQFQYFVAVAEELSFTRAAERLHLSQQGLSTQIEQLEHEMDVALFSRTTRQVELTAAGAAFLRHVRDTLARAPIIRGSPTSSGGWPHVFGGLRAFPIFRNIPENA